MKTQVSIYVKNESLLSKFFSLTWFINIFRKSSVNAYIDDDEARPVKMKASSNPYIFELEPSAHVIYFRDNAAMGKRAFNAFTGAAIGGALGLGTGSLLAGTVGTIVGSDAMKGPRIENNVVQFYLNEGEDLRIRIKPKHNGTFSIKVI